jgi:hypothetical protein
MPDAPSEQVARFPHINDGGIATEVAYWPTGFMAAVDRGEQNLYEIARWAVVVRWAGHWDGEWDRWKVVQGLAHGDLRELSSAGRWSFFPAPMHRRHYRHTFEVACALAAAAVDTVTVATLTWSQWQEQFASRRAAEEVGNA